MVQFVSEQKKEGVLRTAGRIEKEKEQSAGVSSRLSVSSGRAFLLIRTKTSWA